MVFTIINSTYNHCCSVAKLCPTICDPTDYSMSGFPVLHCLLELAQTHGYPVGDAIQPSYPLLSPFSCLQSFTASGSFSNESAPHNRWPKYWSFSFSVSSSNEYSGLVSFKMDWFESKGLSRVFSNTTVREHQFFGAQPSLWSNVHIHT